MATMKEIYPEYYSLDKEMLETLWRDAIFVFDTSVLLNFYKYKDTSLLEQLSKIKDRVWMPYYIGLEFHKNRLRLIYEQLENLKKQVDALEDIKPTKDKFYNFNNKSNPINKEFLSIDIDKLISQAGETFNLAIEQAAKEYEEYKLTLKDDKVLKFLESIYSDRTQDFPYSEESIKKLLDVAKKRFDAKIPPGYMDQAKEEAQILGNTRVDAKFGDFLVWDAIIDYASTQKKGIIFISNDQKEDWIRFVSKERIGPRPELIREFREKTSGQLFHMYTATEFFELSREYLSLTVTSSELEEVEKAAREEVADAINLTGWYIPGVSEDTPESVIRYNENSHLPHFSTDSHLDYLFSEPPPRNTSIFNKAMLRFLLEKKVFGGTITFSFLNHGKVYFHSPSLNKAFLAMGFYVQKINLQDVYDLVTKARIERIRVDAEMVYIFIDLGLEDIDLGFMQGYAIRSLQGDVVLHFGNLKESASGTTHFELLQSYRL